MKLSLKPRVLLAAASCLFAVVASAEDYTLEIDSNGNLTGYTGTLPSKLEIPSSVTQIGSGAFQSCTSLASVTIPESVTNIGYSAFSGCSSLTAVNIPKSVTWIGSGVFNGCPDELFTTKTSSGLTVKIVDGWVVDYDDELPAKLDLPTVYAALRKDSTIRGIVDFEYFWSETLETLILPEGVEYFDVSDCSNLKSITIPASVTEIDGSSFSGCASLATIIVSEDNPCLYMCDGVLFMKEAVEWEEEETEAGTVVAVTAWRHWLVFCPQSKTGAYVVPDDVRVIGWEAFANCENLTSIQLPEGLEEISDYAFLNCTGLTEMTIPPNVSYAESCCFDGCENLTKMTLYMGESLENFWPLDCSEQLKEVVVEGRDDVRYDSLGGIFSCCENLESVVINARISTIDAGEFQDCPNLKSVKIPGSVAWVDPSAFDGCPDELFDTTTIPGVKLVDGWVVGVTDDFEGSLDLSSVRGIASQMFSGCETLTSIVLPTKRSYVESGMFSGCSNLVSVTIPSHVTVIDDSAFANCTSLAEVVLPTALERIGDSAFENCTSLAEVVLPTSLGEIGSGVFDGCSSLAKLTIPASLCAEEGWASLLGCADFLTDLVLVGASEEIAECAFRELSELKSFVFPKGVKTIGAYAFYGCACLESVEIPDGVKTIGESAFSDCESLKSVTIPDSMTYIGYEAFDGCAAELYDAETIPGLRLVDGWVAGLGDDVPETLDLSTARGIVEGALDVVDGVTSLVLPPSLVRIDSMMANCFSELTSVKIPDSVTRIDAGAFDCCSDDFFDTTTIPGVRLVDGWVVGVTDDLPAKLNLSDQGVRGIADGVFCGCQGLKGVTLPADLRRIGDDMFSSCTNLTAITIPSSVTEIGACAFEGCDGLRTLTIPSSVATIGECAFASCLSLKTVTIPQSVCNMGVDEVFPDSSEITKLVLGEGVKSCWTSLSSFYDLETIELPSTIKYFDTGMVSELYLLKEFVVSEENPSYCARNGILYSKDGTRLYRCPPAKSGAVVIPDDVTRIDSCAFENCSELTSVTLPKELAFIDGSAFQGCYGLTKVTMPDNSDVSISNELFCDCLDEICDMETIPGLKLVDGWVMGWTDDFDGNLDLSSANICGIAACAFDGCDVLTSVVLPSSVTFIGNSVFANCYNLTSVTLPSSLTGIGDSAFAFCESLASVVIPANVKSVGCCAFYNCRSLTDVTIASAETEIDETAFRGCPTSIYDTKTIPGVKLLNGIVYGYTSALSGEVTLTGVRRIVSGAFDGCSALTSVVIADGLTSIPDEAFVDCTNLKSVTIPSSVTEIGESAFDGCPDELFDTKTIPGVKMLDVWAVGWTDELPADLDLTGATGLADAAFADCEVLESVKIPASIANFGDNVFACCENLASVTIADGLPNMGAEVFDCCDDLGDTATIPGLRIVDGWVVGSSNDGTELSESIDLSNVRGIAECAFEYTWGVREIVFNCAPPTCGEDAFASEESEDGIKGYYGAAYQEAWKKVLGGASEGVWNGLQMSRLDYWDGAEHATTGVETLSPLGGPVEAFASYRVSDNGRLAVADTTTNETLVTEWVVPRDGDLTHELKIEYLDADGAVVGSATRRLVLPDNGEAPGTTFIDEPTLESSDALAWTRQSATTPEGVATAWQTPVLAAKGTSALTTTVTGPGTLTFQWKRSMSSDGKIQLRLDDGLKHSLSEDADWENDSITIDGGDATEHTVAWKYVAAKSGIEATDAAWVADVHWQPDAGSHAVVFDYGEQATSYDGYSVITQYVAHGFSAYAPGVVEVNSEDYVFAGWSEIPETITEDVVITAQMTRVEKASDYADGVALEKSDWKIVHASATETYLQSAEIGNSTNTVLRGTFEGAGTLSFAWRTSCEEDYDYAYLFVDDKQEMSQTGETDWKTVTVEVAGDGTHVVEWRYEKDESGSDGDDCVQVRDIRFVAANSDPLPELAADATASDVEAALFGSGDARLAEKITTAAQYGAYRAWVDSVAGTDVAKRQAVKESAQSFLAYALNLKALPSSAPKAGDLKIATFESGADGDGVSLPDGTCSLSVSLEGCAVGDGATAENLREIFAVEGTTDLSAGVFDEGEVNVTFETPKGGNVVIQAKPGDSAAKAFFFRVRLR